MKKIAILTDSVSYLNEELLKRPDIRECYMNIIIDDKVYKEIKDITVKEILVYHEQGKKITTSQPSPDEFIQEFDKFKAEGYTDVITILMSSRASGTFQSARIATTMIEGINIHLFDTLEGSVGEEIIVEKAVELLDQKEDIPNIFKYLEKLRDNIKFKVTVDDLRFLARSGRLKMSQALIGNILQFKPLVAIKEGKLELETRIRTTKKVIKKFIDEITEDFNNCKEEMVVKITYIDTFEIAEQLKSKIEEISDQIKVSISREMGPGFAVHFGPGALGVAWTTS